MTQLNETNFDNIAFGKNIISRIGFIPYNFYFPGVSANADSSIGYSLKKFTEYNYAEEQVILLYDDGDIKAPNKGFLLTTKGMHILGYPWFIPINRLLTCTLQFTSNNTIGYSLTMLYPPGITPASDTYNIYLNNEMLIPVLSLIFERLNSDDPMSMPEEHGHTCPNCNHPISEGQKFCMNCGTKLIEERQPKHNFCKNCGAKLIDEAQYCQNCGTKI
ncbi:MAG: zinc ribbon domain-containing protein [Anaerovibrio sp.]|uniref:zinc ribbon domain-containing protein n=1 Tax=Anaerovibrio sp. TaxID=1872532 RepID=UPI0025CEE734|nr:zinc ribbon domain-containing protein [Anaerovibrio sp.]MCR5177158.1 zinc ribbon domain-containing protein [Anaerovibrio sp.]